MILIELAWRFALVSAIAFGGATAVLPEMHRFLVEQNHWIDDTTFAALFAISQASPGPNVVFVALVGWTSARPRDDRLAHGHRRHSRSRRRPFRADHRIDDRNDRRRIAHKTQSPVADRGRRIDRRARLRVRRARAVRCLHV